MGFHLDNTEPHNKMLHAVSISTQRRSEGFWRPGRRLPFGAPPLRRPPPTPPPPTPRIFFLIHQNLRNRLNYSQNLAIKKQIKFLVGRFLVVGDHLDSTFPYFWKIVSVYY